MTNPDGPRGLARGLTNYGDADFALYLRRSFATSMGYSKAMLARPVIGIAQSASGFNNCHRHFPELIDAVKRGVLAAGGLPIDFPTISLGEVFLVPTSLMFRNLMAMDVEEMIRAQPMDAVVLVGGCDKTVPAQLMGAASADVPAIQLVAGPMMTGRHHGERLGACTDCRRFWAKYRARRGRPRRRSSASRSNLATTAGTCAVMGTASTMACIAEALGMSAARHRRDSRGPRRPAARRRGDRQRGRALAATRLPPSQIITPASIENALRVLLAIGGSTNAIIHLTAIAGRVGVEVDLAAPQRAERRRRRCWSISSRRASTTWRTSSPPAASAPCCASSQPMLHLDCLTVTGETLGERLAADDAWVDREVIRPLAEPFQTVGGLVALFGTLAPSGAILKRSAADPALFEREGRAVVFESLDDLAARIDDPDLDVHARRLPGAAERRTDRRPGMPEAGYLPIPGQARARRRQGHGAHLRRAHERHRLRHDRPARVAGVGRRRAARARARPATASA